MSRYNFCIVAEVAGLGREIVSQYKKNCIATEVLSG